MNEKQLKILELAKQKNLARMTLSEIADELNIATPQLVQHHINQLVKKNLLWIDRKAGEMKLLTEKSGGGLLRIPIMGRANCGIATQIADNIVDEYFSISPSLLGLKMSREYFAIQAVGNSMNKARVKTFGNIAAPIDDGDLVIVERKDAMNIDSGKIIVFIADGLANIKKFVKTPAVIRLESESTENYRPIYIDPSADNYIAGEVVGAIKK